jgi:hypothetical protein
MKMLLLKMIKACILSLSAVRIENSRIRMIHSGKLNKYSEFRLLPSEFYL